MSTTASKAAAQQASVEPLVLTAATLLSRQFLFSTKAAGAAWAGSPAFPAPNPASGSNVIETLGTPP